MVKNDVPKTIPFKDLCECVCELITYAFIDEREYSTFRLIDRVLLVTGLHLPFVLN